MQVWGLWPIRRRREIWRRIPVNCLMNKKPSYCGDGRLMAPNQFTWRSRSSKVFNGKHDFYLSGIRRHMRFSLSWPWNYPVKVIQCQIYVWPCSDLQMTSKKVMQGQRSWRIFTKSAIVNIIVYMYPGPRSNHLDDPGHIHFRYLERSAEVKFFADSESPISTSQ